MRRALSGISAFIFGIGVASARTGLTGPSISVGEDVGKGIGRSVVEGLTQNIKDGLSEAFSPVIDALNSLVPSLALAVLILGVIFLVVLMLSSVFTRLSRRGLVKQAEMGKRKKSKEKPAAKKSRAHGMGMESILIDVHKKYTSGEISGAKYREIIQKQRELARTIKMLH